MYTENQHVAAKDLGGGVTRKILSYSDRLMTVELRFPKGAVGAKHSHPHEQIGYLVSGSLIYQEEGCEDKELHTGDTYYVKPDAVHGIQVLEDTVLLDIFTPVRQDFLEGQEADRPPKQEKAMLFLEYPKCSTCKKAKGWLDAHQLSYEDRHIVEENPTAEELKLWAERSGLELKRFFNTSGLKYKELGLKDKLPSMSDEDKLALLSGDGMLVKRPLVITGDRVLVGFKEKEWEALLGQ